MIRSRGTKSHMLVSKWHSETFKTMQLLPVHLEMRNLLTSMGDFVPCDPIMQRAYYCSYMFLIINMGRQQNLCLGQIRQPQQS